jgi:hypothetical protein
VSSARSVKGAASSSICMTRQGAVIGEAHVGEQAREELFAVLIDEKVLPATDRAATRSLSGPFATAL